MTEEQLIYKIYQYPQKVEFIDVINVIDANYSYQPTQFSNGGDNSNIVNEAGQNEGSCKIFAFAKRHNLTAPQTLHCFGKYYRQDVLKQPSAESHPNIRQFIKTGWEGISFQGEALQAK